MSSGLDTIYGFRGTGNPQFDKSLKSKMVGAYQMAVSTWNIVAEGRKNRVSNHSGTWEDGRQVFHRHFFHMFSTKKIGRMFPERPRTFGLVHSERKGRNLKIASLPDQEEIDGITSVRARPWIRPWPVYAACDQKVSRNT